MLSLLVPAYTNNTLLLCQPYGMPVKMECHTKRNVPTIMIYKMLPTNEVYLTQ